MSPITYIAVIAVAVGVHTFVDKPHTNKKAFQLKANCELCD